jgi:hypothetical protein
MTKENPSGWEPKGNGWYEGPKMVDSSTPEFTEFAEASRSRWDIAEYFKTLISQSRRKQNSANPQKPQ